MILLNRKMIPVYNSINWGRKNRVNSKLSKLLESEFITADGCFFLKQLFEDCKNLQRNSFEDETAYEAFVNSIHLTDYVPAQSVATEQAIFFLIKLFRRWNKLENGLILKAVISGKGDNVLLWFHVSRKNENLFDEGAIDTYLEPTCIMTSNDW